MDRCWRESVVVKFNSFDETMMRTKKNFEMMFHSLSNNFDGFASIKKSASVSDAKISTSQKVDFYGIFKPASSGDPRYLSVVV